MWTTVLILAVALNLEAEASRVAAPVPAIAVGSTFKDATGLCLDAAVGYTLRKMHKTAQIAQCAASAHKRDWRLRGT
jgi:hypothetical protein